MDAQPLSTIFKTTHIVSLNALHRDAMRAHFLSLGAHDRFLRFGSTLKDESICAYVDGIDFQRDVIYGVFDGRLNLVGVGHLAVTQKMDGNAEFGLSVLESHRGKGFASALFERAIIHCRNLAIHTLVMQCLTSNAAVMHIARKLGMTVVSGHGESDAYLILSPGNPATFVSEAASEQAANMDYAWKANFSFVTRFLEAADTMNTAKNTPLVHISKSSEYS